MPTDVEINKEIKSLKKQKHQNKWQELLNDLKDKYVIFAFCQNDIKTSFYYYITPLPLDYSEDNLIANGGYNYEYAPTFDTKALSKHDLEKNVDKFLATMNYSNPKVENNENIGGEDDAQWYQDDYGEEHHRNYFFFTKTQIHKIISHAPKDIQDVLKSGVHPAKFVLEHK